MSLYFDDEGFDGQLQRTIGKCDARMANVGECLYIASRTISGNRDSWHTQWSAFADGLVAQASDAQRSGHAISAASLRLRAAEYYRQAFFWHRDDLNGTELTTAYRASVEAFRSALPFLPRPGQVIEGDTPGYLFAPPSGGPFPTILHIGGYDSTAEELYASVYPALDRGWAFVGLDGPGQGCVLYDRRVPQRPDWESVVAAMFELVAGMPQVDPCRIVLVRRSFGGLLAPRGAAAVPRIAALIVDPTFRTCVAIQVLSWHRGSSARASSLMTRSTPCRPVRTATLRSIDMPEGIPQVPTRAEGAEGHCKGMAPIVFWTAALDWLENTLCLA